MYCELWGQAVETIKAKKPINVAALTQMRLYAIELGLTPAARVKLAVEHGTPPVPGGDVWADMLSQEGRQN